MGQEYCGSYFWAKKDDTDRIYKWLPLSQHLLDTMNVSALLWEHWLSEGQRALITSSLSIKDEEIAKNLVKFIGGIHDLGKATPAFQTKKNAYKNTVDLDHQLLEILANYGFKDIGDLNLVSSHKSHHALASQVLLSSYGVGEDISSIVGGHHGRPVERQALRDQLGSYGSNYYQVEKKEDPIHINWDKAQREIYHCMLKLAGFESVEDLPKIESLSAQVVMEGLLIMADWIASNETYFPLIRTDQDESVIDQRLRIESGWSRWKKTDIWQAKDEGDITDLFNERFEFSPRDVQFKIAEAIRNSENPGIFIIEAPMGLGKTEAALFSVEQLAAKMGKSGMFFGLPTQATSDGIFGRINAWTKKVSTAYDERTSIQLIHGKAYLNEEFKSMAHNIDEDGAKSSSVIVNEWFAGRKTSILDDFVVGTVDQFLLSALKRKHLALAHMGLSKKVVVIDEVHAYDSYMSQYLNQAVRWMGSYQVPVVILSATLPSKKRVELMKSYIRGRGEKVKHIFKPDDWKETTAYPLITYLDGKTIYQMKDFKISESKKVHVKKIDEEDLVELLQDKLSEGGVTGIIVNTVKRAQRIAKFLGEIFGKEHVELLHSSFLSPHRIAKEKDLLEMIGKGKERPDKKIIVGTQVIEQSLDIDFDLLISDLAPMDLLLQRLGRLHRHEIFNRPDKLKIPQIYVMGTSASFDFEEGSSFIYGDYLLCRTQHYLKDMISLPEDISILVQKVYGEEEIELSQDLRGKYQESKVEFEGKIKKKEEKAKAYLLGDPSYRKDDSLVDWLNNANESESLGFAQVRDTEDSIEVILLKKCGDGYSFLDEDEDISMRVHEFNIGKKLASQTLKLPNALSKGYSIDKTIDCLEGLYNENFSNWKDQPWLNGALGIILDQDMSFNKINGFTLKYSYEYGLEYEKVVAHGQI